MKEIKKLKTPETEKINTNGYNAYIYDDFIYCVHRGWILNDLCPTYYSKDNNYITVGNNNKAKFLCELPREIIKQAELKKVCKKT